MNKEELNNLEHGEEVLYKEGNVVGEVIEKPGAKVLNFSSDDVEESEIPDVIKPEKLIKMPLCDEGHEEAIFNDKKEKWQCPFCRDDDDSE